MNGEHLERLLDQALEATFPASDPIAVSPVTSSDAAEIEATAARGTVAL
jgi:hypothetical protein